MTGELAEAWSTYNLDFALTVLDRNDVGEARC
jgi:hypothetical protein